MNDRRGHGYLDHETTENYKKIGRNHNSMLLLLFFGLSLQFQELADETNAAGGTPVGWKGTFTFVVVVVISSSNYFGKFVRFFCFLLLVNHLLPVL